MPSKFKSLVRTRIAKTRENWQTAARNVRAAVLPKTEAGSAIAPLPVFTREEHAAPHAGIVADPDGAAAYDRDAPLDDEECDGPCSRAIGQMPGEREWDPRFDALLDLVNVRESEVSIMLEADGNRARLEQNFWMGSEYEAWNDSEFEWTPAGWTLVDFDHQAYGARRAYHVARWEEFEVLAGASESTIRAAAATASLDPELDAAAIPWASTDVRRRMTDAVLQALVPAFLDEHCHPRT